MHHSFMSLRAVARHSVALSPVVAIVISLLALTNICDAQTSPKGVVLFTRPPSTYPELLEFVTLTKTSVAFSQVVRPDGRRGEIPNPGIVGVFEYPPATPNAATAQQAATIIAQIDAALAKYPRGQYRDVHGKLVPMAASWRTMQQLAARMVKPSATPAPKQGITITTKDGHAYEDVQITKVNPDSISFTHSAGAATVDFEDLSAGLQRQYNYDPKLAAAAREARAIAKAVLPKNSPTMPNVGGAQVRPSNEFSVVLATTDVDEAKAHLKMLLGYSSIDRVDLIPEGIRGPLLLLGAIMNGELKVTESEAGMYAGFIHSDRLEWGVKNRVVLRARMVFEGSRAGKACVVVVAGNSVVEFTSSDPSYPEARLSCWWFNDKTKSADVYLLR